MLIPHVRLTLQAEHAAFLARPCKRHSEWSLEIVIMDNEAQKTQNEFFVKLLTKPSFHPFESLISHRLSLAGPLLPSAPWAHPPGTQCRCASVSDTRCSLSLEEIKSMLLKRMFKSEEKKHFRSMRSASAGIFFGLRWREGLQIFCPRISRPWSIWEYRISERNERTFSVKRRFIETADRSDRRLKSARGRQESNGWPGKLSHDPLLEPP